MPEPELVRTSIKLPSDLLDEITLASDAWARAEGYLPTGSRNNWIIKVLRKAVEDQLSKPKVVTDFLPIASREEGV